MMQLGSYSESDSATDQSWPFSPLNFTANFCILSLGAAWAGPVTARRLATAHSAAAAKVFIGRGLPESLARHQSRGATLPMCCSHVATSNRAASSPQVHH